ncbi:unnamed protein product [Owenia fusiformis]|uniref:mitogen-activated protein kinase kinase n=1 Tax=Owenia fusiformis TaxID=6347 RepID=A0A8J1TYF0_OWEFU|nr:unnamed protein product [Owenia fusiformis]
MDSSHFVIRIQTDDDECMDWTVREETATFDNVLQVISKALPDTPVYAFDYDDEEDDDRITVRTQEEMTNMISMYYSSCQRGGTFTQPLVIYPRVGKQPEKRNKLNLKIQTSKKSEQQATPKVTPPVQTSHKQKEGDIEAILACGQINHGDLHIDQILGNGSSGTVYKAVHQPTRTPMALKVIQLDIAVEVQTQIISELEILYKCNSPYIIGFYGAYFIENKISMCTEWMDGGSLDKYGRVPEPVLGRISLAVVRGLQYLWSLKVMHRDVKPSNILVNTAGHVKLCDFGVSVQLVNSIAKTYIGTNAYMAPERIQGQEYNIFSEVWSLGISLFEMAIGRFPYDTVVQQQLNSSPMALLNTIVKDAPPILPVGQFSDAFIHLVSQCMQKEPKSRPNPGALLQYPFMATYADDNVEVIAFWVRNKLEEIFLRQSKQKLSS